MGGVFLTEPAVFLIFHPFRMFLFILVSGVRLALTFLAHKIY